MLLSNLWEITQDLPWASSLTSTATSHTWSTEEPWEEVETRGRRSLRSSRQTLQTLVDITSSPGSNSIGGVLGIGVKGVPLRLASGSLITNWIVRNEFITLTMPRTQNTSSIIKWVNLKALSLIKMCVMVRPPKRMSVFRHRLIFNLTRSLLLSRAIWKHSHWLKICRLGKKAGKPPSFLTHNSMKRLWNWCRLVNRI